MYLFGDIETRSTKDVTVCGAYELAKDPDLRLLCFSYAIGDGPVETWHCAFHKGQPDLSEAIPYDLLVALEDPECMFVAWNAAFERIILNAVRKKYGLPKLPVTKMFCMQAWAQCFNLPGKLETCTKEWLPASKAKKDGKPTSWMWSTKKPMLPEHEKAYRDGQVPYCEHDVSSMRDMFRLLPDPTQQFIDEYHASEAINDRGCMMDLDLINAAIKLSPAVEGEIKAELDEITGGTVKPRGPSLRKWLMAVLPPELTELLQGNKKKRSGYGWATTIRPSTDKKVRAALLEAMDEYEGMDDVREALALYDEANRAAVKKYEAARDRTDPEEGCLRGQYKFAGAAQTGRFSATGVQVHNLIRMVPKDATKYLRAILSHDPDHIRKVTGMTVNQALSMVIRCAFMAEQGRRLIWGDWSSIEARMLPWLSADEAAERVLNAYRAGADLYIEEAAGIYGIPKDKVDKDQRQAGKVVILACGYNGGVNAYQSMARNYGIKIPDAEAMRIVKGWRRNNPWARRFWRKLEQGAIRAIKNPGIIYEAGRIQFVFVPGLLRGTLLAFLPSGRPLAYPDAKVVMIEKFGHDQEAVVFRHPVFGMVDTYGGKIAENCLAGDTDVMTERGWVKITDVLLTDRLWDGVEWVKHDGLTYKGNKHTLSYQGVNVTPEHLILTTGGWKDVRTALAQGLHGAEVRMPDSGGGCRVGRKETDVAIPLRLRGYGDPNTRRRDEVDRAEERPVVRVHGGGVKEDAWHVTDPGLCSVAQHDRQVRPSDASGVAELRGAGDPGLPEVAEFRELLGRHGSDISTGADAGSHQQRQRLSPVELSLGNVPDAGGEYEDIAGSEHAGDVTAERYRTIDAALSLAPQAVYDIVNAGPRSRFVVRSSVGPLIVHNCTQAESASLLRSLLVRVAKETALHTHDECVLEVPEDEVEIAAAKLHAEMVRVPEWADGLPLAAEVEWGERYKVPLGHYKA